MLLSDAKSYALRAWSWASSHAALLAIAGLVLASGAATFYGWRANSEHKKADRYAAAAAELRTKGDEVLAKVAKLEAREVELDREVARLQASRDARRRELPPVPARAVQPPSDLGELRSALVTAGLRADLQLVPEEPTRVHVADAKIMFNWKASADRVPGLEARLEADARLQQASDALVAGLTTDLSATKEASAQKSVVIKFEGETVKTLNLADKAKA